MPEILAMLDKWLPLLRKAEAQVRGRQARLEPLNTAWQLRPQPPHKRLPPPVEAEARVWVGQARLVQLNTAWQLRP